MSNLWRNKYKLWTRVEIILLVDFHLLFFSAILVLPDESGSELPDAGRNVILAYEVRAVNAHTGAIRG